MKIIKTRTSHMNDHSTKQLHERDSPSVTCTVFNMKSRMKPTSCTNRLNQGWG